MESMEDYKLDMDKRGKVLFEGKAYDDLVEQAILWRDSFWSERVIREVERKETARLRVELEESLQDKESLKASLANLEEKRAFWQEQALYFNEELRKCDMDKREIAALKDEVARLRRCLARGKEAFALFDYFTEQERGEQ